MSRFVNMGLLSHPLNWITVFLWLVILGFVITAFHPSMMTAYGNNPNQG